MKENQQKKESTVSTGFLSVLMLSFLFIILGGALYMNGKISMLWFYYLVASAFCLSGLFSVIVYFARKEYLDLSKYGFSYGVFALILGVCLMLRAQDFAGASIELFGILILLHSVILLQYAVQVYLMEGSAAGILMLFTLIEDIVAVMSIAEPNRIFHRYTASYGGLLVLCGVLGLVAMILVKFRWHNLKNEMNRDRERILEDDPTDGVQKEEIERVEAEVVGEETPAAEMETDREKLQEKQKLLLEEKEETF